MTRGNLINQYEKRLIQIWDRQIQLHHLSQTVENTNEYNQLAIEESMLERELRKLGR